MAVKVFCGICEKFIKNAEEYEFQKLTGKEKCEDCGKKIAGLFQILDDKIKHFNVELERMLGQTKKKFGTLDNVHNKFHSDARSLYTTTRAELESHLQSILEGEKAE